MDLSVFIRSLYWLLAAVLLLTSCKHDPPIPPGPDPGGVGGGVNPPDTTVPVFCDPDSIYFQQEILPLLVSSCGVPGCHNAQDAEEGVILTDYANIMATADVRPFDPEGSDLYELITEEDLDDRMPPQPEYEALQAEQIALIRNWILQGALNNSCQSSCDTSNVLYTNRIAPLISTSCLGCHSGSAPQGGIDLSTYAAVSQQALFGPLLDAVQHTGTATPMPYQSAMLPPCEVELIQIWIANGAPE